MENELTVTNLFIKNDTVPHVLPHKQVKRDSVMTDGRSANREFLNEFIKKIHY